MNDLQFTEVGQLWHESKEIAFTADKKSKSGSFAETYSSCIFAPAQELFRPNGGCSSSAAAVVLEHQVAKTTRWL